MGSCRRSHNNKNKQTEICGKSFMFSARPLQLYGENLDWDNLAVMMGRAECSSSKVSEPSKWYTSTSLCKRNFFDQSHNSELINTLVHCCKPLPGSTKHLVPNAQFPIHWFVELVLGTWFSKPSSGNLAKPTCAFPPKPPAASLVREPLDSESERSRDGS